MERAIDEGLTPEELVLAAHIKVIWAHNDLYWIAFDSTGSTRLSYHALSWRMALLIVRSYESTPQVEEIDVLLEQLFEYWYENATLRRVFKAFARYLWYRFGDLEAVLPPSVCWDFDSPHRWPKEECSDLGVPDDLGIQELQKLRSHGVPHIKTLKYQAATSVTFPSNRKRMRSLGWRGRAVMCQPNQPLATLIAPTTRQTCHSQRSHRKPPLNLQSSNARHPHSTRRSNLLSNR